MTDITITRPLQRWHKLVKALDEIRPGLRGDDAIFADKLRKRVYDATAGLMGSEPVGISGKRDNWLRFCNFAERHVIGYQDVHEQLRGGVAKPEFVPEVDPELVAESRRYMDMDDAEFEAATRPAMEPEGPKQPTLF